MPPNDQTPQELPATTQEALLAGVAVQAGHLATISEQLVKQLRMSKLERVFFVSMTLLIVALGSVLVLLAFSNRENTAATKDSTSIILDCTQPGGKCFQRGQQQTAQAVTSIVQSQLASAWCSLHSKTFSDAQKCVIKLTTPH